MSKEFPDIAFVNVDGQAVPFTKPQHYKKGSTTDTLLTGEDNPLPTKDESVEARLQAIEQTQSQILNKLNDTIDTRLTGSNVEDGLLVEDISKNIEVIYSETEFTCPANSFKALDYIDVSKFKDFFIHFVPSGLAEYSVYYYIKRPNGSTLTRRKVTDISTSSNGMTDRFTINSITSAIAIENKTDIDHVFGEIWLFGVRR